ncbi:MAG: histidine--tRNA ligase [Bacteriovoracaceae bacterium]|jgi:histidyl-tRNA synthetase|nr:histidine--tRNA ligase [Bacteriovoracaceae bacterium]
MALSKKPYKGCRDFYPELMEVQNFMFGKMHETSKKFSYVQYDGPLLEEVKLYLAKSGEELISGQIYDFTDKGKRHVAIRPEMTPTVARMVAGIHRETAKPIRWYSISNFMRYERPQKGRLREFIQLNVDIFGAKESLASLEVIDYIITFLKSFGGTKDMFSIGLNDRKVVDAIFKTKLELSDETSLALYKIIDKSKKISEDQLNKEISETIADENKETIFKNYLSIKSFDELSNFLKENSIDMTESALSEFIELIKELDLSDYINYDPSIVRGLDYYTGIVFEVFDLNPENKRAIAGGGAYQNLLGIFNEGPLGGVGFGMGDVTLREFLEAHNLLPKFDTASSDLYIAYFDQEAQSLGLKLSSQLRSSGLNVELNLGSLKANKFIKTALAKNHKFGIGLGSNEVSSGTISVKKFSDKTSKEFNTNQIIDIIEYIKE